MFQKYNNKSIDVLLAQRNTLVAVVLFLLLLNFLLTIAIFHKNTLVILTPMVNERSSVSFNSVSNEYLGNFSRDFMYLLNNVTPDNIEYVTNAILALVSPTAYGTMKQQLDELAMDLHKRKLSTSFFATAIETDTKRLKAKVFGFLKSYIGHKEVTNKQVVYELAFKYDATGLKVTGLIELDTEEQRNVK